MILLETHSRFLLQILQNRMKSLERPVELDYHFVEFDDVRYHIQATVKDPYHMVLSILIPTPPPETVFSGGLPFGATEAVKGAYGAAVQIVDTPEEGFQLTLKLDLAKLPSDEGPASLLPKPEKVTVVFPMRFKDSVDVILATSFLQEFMEARRTAGLNNAPPCVWSPSPPLELKGAPAHALNANAGFVSFVIFPRHVVGKKLEKTVWSLSTFHAYVNYHIKCSKSFMHTRMRRRVETLIQALNRAKPDVEKEKKTAQGRSFRRQLTK